MLGIGTIDSGITLAALAEGSLTKASVLRNEDNDTNFGGW